MRDITINNNESYDKNKKRVMERIYKMQKFNHVVFCAAHIRNVITENRKAAFFSESGFSLSPFQ